MLYVMFSYAIIYFARTINISVDSLLANLLPHILISYRNTMQIPIATELYCCECDDKN